MSELDDKITSAVLTDLVESGVADLYPIGYVCIVRCAQQNQATGQIEREVALLIAHERQSPFATYGLLHSGIDLIGSATGAMTTVAWEHVDDYSPDQGS